MIKQKKKLLYDILSTRGLEDEWMRDQVIFKCSECNDENYIGTRNKRKNPEKMIIQKYCPKCNKKTAHKEKK